MDTNRICYTRMESPIGRLLLARNAQGLIAIRFSRGKGPRAPEPSWQRSDGAFEDAAGQLEAYFDGRLKDFDLPLAPQGTAFQRTVWKALLDIPYGETASYGDQARRIGRPNASRAVGAANGKNPLPIVIPCHRVIGSNGQLTGYAGGLPIKQQLLGLERRHADKPDTQLTLA